MAIKIAERLRPYSHLPGTVCLVPGSPYAVQVFPTLIRLYRLDKAELEKIGEIALDIQGPLSNFTLQSDLEKGVIRVWGESPAGFVRYYISSHSQGKALFLHLEKAPANGMGLEKDGKKEELAAKQSLDLFSFCPLIGTDFQLPSLERLSLGSHKAQDWDLVRRRLDLKEILPVWHRLGQLLPNIPSPMPYDGGTASLLQSCAELINQQRGGESAVLWNQLFQAGFQSLLVPRLIDTDYQGFLSSMPAEDAPSPLFLLTEGARLIRRLFIEQEKALIRILPMLPPQFPSGRLLSVQLQGGSVLDLEWTKKTIRCLSLFVPSDQQLVFHFKKVKEFRLRKGKKEAASWLKTGETLFLEKNCHYFFDNFR
ncbi:hypothetical protein [Candidatus Protochlamydia phocaeensis]|uniref:hypothetical protein n=1 Tax=Candidatus Protochlamydia phocaeensis TaxID=1414722 RepID=UPI000837EEBC|nr:hypothetical protein [Candidatus Protochlamydia phocaeensis]